MNLTSPDNIAYASTSDDLSVEDITSAMATSIQTALTGRQLHTYRWADAAARTAQAGMSAGDRGYQTDTATEYIYTGSAWRINTGGMILLASSAPSAAANVSFDNVFSTAFRSYHVRYDFTGGGFSTIRFQVRAGGSTISTSTYDEQYTYSGGTAVMAINNATSSIAVNISGTAAAVGSGSFDVYGAPLAIATTVVATSTKITAANALVTVSASGQNRNSTAYDGFILVPNAGTLTGRVAVYGVL